MASPMRPSGVDEVLFVDDKLSESGNPLRMNHARLQYIARVAETVCHDMTVSGVRTNECPNSTDECCLMMKIKF